MRRRLDKELIKESVEELLRKENKGAGADAGVTNAVKNDVNGINDLLNGSEREARVATNKTLGTGEAVLTDKNGHHISEQRFMGFVKAGAAKGFLAQGLAGEADLEKAFESQGLAGEKKLKGSMANGLYRGESANLANTEGMAELRGEKNHKISDNEFYKNIKASSIEKGDMAQAHAEKMRNDYGDNLDKANNSFAVEQLRNFEQKKKDLIKSQEKLDSKISNLEDQQTNGGLTPETGKQLEDLKSQRKELNKQISNIDDQINKVKPLAENPMTFAEVASNIATSQVDSQYGQAIGIRKNLEQNGDIYSQNSAYGEMSKQQTTNAKIETLGGVDKAVALDTKGAEIKATEDKAGLTAKVQEALQKEGIDKDKAKELANAVVEGSRAGAEEFKKALENIGSKTDALVGAKERSDYAKIDQYNKADDFKEAQKLTAIQQEARGALKTFETAGNQETRQKLLDQQVETAKRMKQYEDFKRDAIELGFAKEENGKLVATNNAEDWVKGRALASNSSIDRMFIGGMRMDQQYNALGEGLVNADASIKGEKGANFKANIGNPDNMNQAEAQERSELAMNPKKLLQNMIGKGYDAIRQSLEENGFGEDDANMIATALTAGGAGVASAASIEATQTLFNNVAGKRVATQDFSYIDKNGNTQQVHAGKEFKLSNIPEEFRAEAIENSKVEPGIVRKVMGAIGGTAWGELDKFGNKIRSSFTSSTEDQSMQKTSDTSDNSSNNSQDQSSESGRNNKSEHFDTPSNNDSNIVNDGGENVKSSANDSMANKFKNVIEGISHNKKLSMLVGGAGAAALFGVGENAEAKETPTNVKETQQSASQQEDMVGDAITAGETALNAYQAKVGADEIRNGVKATQYLEDGAEALGKIATKGAVKEAGKLIPGVGFALGMKFAEERFNEGDYVGAGLEAVSGAASLVPGLGTLTSAGIDTFLMARDLANNNSHISPAAATMLQQSNDYQQTQPSSGVDYHTAIANQVTQLQATQNMSQALEQIKDTYHPTAPAVGVTVPTMAGNLSIGTADNGNLQIGNYTTNVPMSEYRSYMQSNPEAAQQLAQALSSAPLNNNNTQELWGAAYEKRDNGTMENLLSDLTYYNRVNVKDTQIGLGGVMEMMESLVEKQEEQLRILDPDKNESKSIR